MSEKNKTRKSANITNGGKPKGITELEANLEEIQIRIKQLNQLTQTRDLESYWD
jgi:hypothetical protein